MRVWGITVFGVPERIPAYTRPGTDIRPASSWPGRRWAGVVRCAGVSMDKKKLVRKVQTVKTIKDFNSSVIRTCMAVLFASSTVQLASSCFTSGLSRTVGSLQVRL